MKSWIMRSWLQSHDESKWPDLSICQTEDACHVTDLKSHPSKEEIENMCPDEFFAKHKYTYVDNDSLDCPKAGTCEASKSLGISSEHQAAHGSLTLVRDDYEGYEDCDYSYCSKAETTKAKERLGISSEDQATYRSLVHLGGTEDYEFSPCPKARTSEASVSLDISSGYQASYSSLTPVRDEYEDYQDCEDYDYSSCSKAGTPEAKERLGMSSEDSAAYGSLNLLGHAEDHEISYCQKAGTSEASRSLHISSEYQASYGSPIPVERNNFMAMNHEPKGPHDNDSAYLCPVTIEAEQHSDNENHSSNLDTSEGFECRRSHTEIYQAGAVSRTPHETPYSQKTKIKKDVVEDSNVALGFDPDEASLLGTETGQPLIEGRCQGQETFPQLNRTPVACNNSAGVSEGNPIALAWLNDPRLEVISF